MNKNKWASIKPVDTRKTWELLYNVGFVGCENEYLTIVHTILPIVVSFRVGKFDTYAAYIYIDKSVDGSLFNITGINPNVKHFRIVEFNKPIGSYIENDLDKTIQLILFHI